MTDKNEIELDLDKPQRGIYLLPNLMTTFALFSGFYAIVAAMNKSFDMAAIAIFVAMIADGLDGRIARSTNTQSNFGAQYDSMSDMAAFGIAPALVVYSWSLHSLGKIGWLAAFLYAAGTALRLARFNTQVVDKDYFQGFSCTAAAGVIAGMVWAGSNYLDDATLIAAPVAALTLLVAVMMVSTIRYSSFKSVDFKGRVPFVTVVLAVFIIAGIALEPPETLFTIFLVYLASGPLLTLWELRRVRNQRRLEKIEPRA